MPPTKRRVQTSKGDVDAGYPVAAPKPASPPTIATGTARSGSPKKKPARLCPLKPGLAQRSNRRSGGKTTGRNERQPGAIVLSAVCKAKKLVGENTEKLSYDRVMRSLNKRVPGIMRDHKAKGVSFGVEVKGNRVVIKAKPKK